MILPIIDAAEMAGGDRLRQVMTTLSDVFQDLRSGKEQSPPRTLLDHGRSEMLVSPASWLKRGVASVKITTLTPGNAEHGLPLIHGVVVLTDINTGQMLALLDGASLTAVRTGAVAGLATDLCANADAGNLAILGAGVQARAVLLAMLAVRPIRKVRIFSRTPARTDRFVQWARTVTTAEIAICHSVFEAVRGADIICTTTSTSSSKPLIEAGWVTPGAHLNIIGGTHEEAIEVDPALLKTAFVVVETAAAAQEDAGEVRTALTQGYLQPEDLNELGAVILGESAADEGQTTLFRSVGLAIEDTAAAIALYPSTEKKSC
ncbi:ornithine cyclodeaminase [Serratia quinivorans]|jgi:ornithine cyclodeaminase|uniref:ornithine cyclodeaminase family protein n=1 Tax=Serratia quinivorans TaxID=137545 RepID=UPI002178CB5B|nr:ornithine cyclodeaminase family protein [Serratia quinivorans]CAI0759917.1 ornithine cyclodeaminase [Serratia quinivorans]CAI1519045.1 ornithine cyclodeaminase [Serratia quinivorans]CAI1615584.1 ornithine cyclodeaminase [Serratia quinivorans]CAI2078649.1 ornithine cyclodeaminase [Serratia quinivorans]CAI2097302.1 ornithine cyclodeaminase [Serratia quinivorans]